MEIFTHSNPNIEHLRVLTGEGYVRLPAAVPLEATRTLLELLWADYSLRHGISRNDPIVWSSRKGQDIRLYGPLPLSLTESPDFAVLTSKIRHAVDDLLGTGAWRLRGKATLFVNCPSPSGKWSMPTGWHTDVSVDPGDHVLKFLYVFAFLDYVEPCGGGTMLLSGSTRRIHLMGETVKKGGQNLKEVLAQEDNWFAELFNVPPGFRRDGGRLGTDTLEEQVQRFMKKGAFSAGVPMHVVELTGAPGDLIIWDPRSLHTASDNIGDRPRSVIRFRIDSGLG